MKRYIKSANIVLALAVGVVTGAWLLVAALFDFYYRDPSPGFEGGRIVFLSARTVRSGRPASIQRVTAQQVIQAELGLEAKTAFKATGFFAATQGSLPQPVYGVTGTPDFFKVFAPGQNVPELPPGGTNLIVSRSLASRLFPNPSQALGETIWLEGESHVVSFVSDDNSWPSGLFALPGPVKFFLLSDRIPEPAVLAGRLGDKASLAQAEHGLDQLLRQPEAWPAGVDSSYLRGAVQTLDERVRLSASWAPGLLAGCLLLLMLALGTASQLLVQDVHDQSSGWILRSVLGATRRQVSFHYLKRLLPTLLAGAGLGGLAAATALLKLSQNVPFPVLAEAQLVASPMQILMQAGLALGLCAGLAALGPFLWLGRAELGQGLQHALHPSLWAGRVHTAFTAFQLALLTAVVISAHSVLTLYSQKLDNAAGFQQKDLFYVRIYTPPEYDAEAQLRHLPVLIRSVEAYPQVKALALSHFYLPLLSDGTSGMEVEAGNAAQLMTLSIRKVSPNFFEVMGLSQPQQPLNESLPEHIVISQSFRDKLGILRNGYPASFRVGISTVTAVGDTADTVDLSLLQPSAPALYYPLMVSKLTRWPFLVLRSEKGVGPAMVQRLVEGELLRLKIPAFVAPVLSAQQVVEDRLALTSFLYSIFFLLAVVVTLVSLCSVVATVHRETVGRLHELAVRRALGATSASVGVLLLRRIVAGALVGVLGGALLATKVSGALAEALGSIGSLKDALPGLALVFAAAVATAALSFHSFSKVELTDLLRKE